MTAASQAPVGRSIAIRSLHRNLRFERGEVVAALRLLDAHRSRFCTADSTLENDHELSVVFLTDAALAKLHADFLSDPSITDVITFSGDPALGTAGEICVSADAATRFSSPRRATFSDELTLYLVHGWLHLVGHDDMRPDRKRRMRRAEARALRLLRTAQAMPQFALSRAKKG